MNTNIKYFIEQNITLIESSRWDLVFEHASEMLNVTIISELIRVLENANVLDWSKLSKIPDGAFLADSLHKFVFPNTINTIGHKSFAYTRLRDIFIPATVKEIQSYAFTGCYSLENVIIEGAHYINSGVFAGCNNLRHVQLPAELLDIESDVFHGCTSKVDIDFLGTKEQWLKLTYFDDTSYFTRSNIGYIECIDGTVKE